MDVPRRRRFPRAGTRAPARCSAMRCPSASSSHRTRSASRWSPRSDGPKLDRDLRTPAQLRAQPAGEQTRARTDRVPSIVEPAEARPRGATSGRSNRCAISARHRVSRVQRRSRHRRLLEQRRSALRPDRRRIRRRRAPAGPRDAARPSSASGGSAAPPDQRSAGSRAAARRRRCSGYRGVRPAMRDRVSRSRARPARRSSPCEIRIARTPPLR